MTREPNILVWVGQVLGAERPVAGMIDGSSGLTMGPLFDSPEAIDRFRHFLRLFGVRDPRAMSTEQLRDAHARWVAHEELDDRATEFSSADTEPCREAP
jgi:hypothetical protein